jgi:hypothetical protein
MTWRWGWMIHRGQGEAIELDLVRRDGLRVLFLRLAARGGRLEAQAAVRWQMHGPRLRGQSTWADWTITGRQSAVAPARWLELSRSGRGRERGGGRAELF